MEQEILNALRPAFPDVYGDVTLEESTDCYNGYVLSKGFEELTFAERQRHVFDILRESFGSKAQRIAFIFTYTPYEYELLQAA